MYQKLGACLVRNSLILLLLNKASIRSSRSSIRTPKSLGRSQKSGGNVEVSVVINGIVG